MQGFEKCITNVSREQLKHKRQIFPHWYRRKKQQHWSHFLFEMLVHLHARYLVPVPSLNAFQWRLPRWFCSRPYGTAGYVLMMADWYICHYIERVTKVEFCTKQYLCHTAKWMISIHTFYFDLFVKALKLQKDNIIVVKLFFIYILLTVHVWCH